MAPDLNQVDRTNALKRDCAMVWMHIGDLHLTRVGESNHLALREIVAQANEHLAGAVDFAVLPGDNADDGTPEQYRILRPELARLKVPLHILPGDHDFKSRSLSAFYSVLGAEALPKAVTVKSCRCIFLDFVSAGSGGPDFRLGFQQIDWLGRELDSASARGLSTVVFAHGYPADLANQSEAEVFHGLLKEHRVLVVDMGHTHYNELANDGQTIYAATRSTGQIEEGPAGFSLLAVDQGVVSWRFKTLAQPWPLVLITSPADRRLITRPHLPNHIPSGRAYVRAKAWSGDGIQSVECRVDNGAWRRMCLHEQGQCWELECEIPDTGFRLTVRATDARGNRDKDCIEVAATGSNRATPHADGSDRDTVGEWPEKHLLGTQLGPNRNGRKW
ncbi:3',5'-cyclic adenosine monophosphate phosphodiesterase CpdA [Paraburkholderia domus]|uniref:metallophosphoesterase n=1 Tax=Paraburkholderia domus TaxID=2793075 RepID=UPI0019145D38|nr:metallophosphoesterase [Paraburkholderia domus]MBK5090605.1 metallophosphoesterase [Burkholderia sp. R-69927]CAE6909228.1 3',5'-cyclic adenosine monophosphate phosphodiesterase CpdA [Paraburkholderia domus]